MIKATEERITGARNLGLHIRSWRPAEPVAVVVICHGVNSHGGYYQWAAEQFVRDGIATHALDLHGRGRSEGERFYLERMSDYVEDVDALVELARSREPGLPVFLLGHSAGGVISCTYALHHQKKLAGLICESFAFQVAAPDFVLTIVKWLAGHAPRLGVLKLKNRDFSRDPSVVAAMNADPLIHNETQPAQTVAELARANDRLRREFPLINLPLMILHGGADKVTNPRGSQFFHQTAGSKDKTLELYDEHVHDLLNDRGRDLVMSDMLAWLEARIPAVARQTVAIR